MQDQLSFDNELLQGRFVQIPAALVRSSKVSPNAVKLYCILISYAIDKAVAWPGQDTLCEQMGVSERSLRTTIGELKALGLVTTQRGGDGKTMRYHVSKTVVSVAKNATSESSEWQETQDMKPHEEVQSGKKRQSRAAKNDGSYKEEVYKEEIYKAATQSQSRETHDLPVDAHLAAAADNSIKKQTRQTGQARETKPPKPEPVPLPHPNVSLLDYSEADIERLRKTNPAELVRRFRAQNPAFADRMAKKAATAHTSPNPLLARCIVEDWLPEIRDIQAAPPAPAPRPYVPPPSIAPPAFIARYEAARAARRAALEAEETGRVVH